jgi:Zn finger protein HypA/HybF involved in hydrogenase expression
MPDVQFRPLVYFWIAFYNDETCLPQFDIESGKENNFRDIDQSKLDKFGIFPFTATMALNANRIKGFMVALEVANLPYFIMKLQENQRLIFFRRNKIHTFTYLRCTKCEYDWEFMRGYKEGAKAEIGLTIHSNDIVQEWAGKKYSLAVCPKCGSFNAIVCTDCKDTLINELKRAESEEHYFKCPKCNKEYIRYIKTLEDQLRALVYLVGYQTTVDGRNIKQVMFISEDGTFEMSDSL